MCNLFCCIGNQTVIIINIMTTIRVVCYNCYNKQFLTSALLFLIVVIYELAIDIVHTLGCERECMQQMLLSAVRHSIVDVSKYYTFNLFSVIAIICHLINNFDIKILILKLSFFTGCQAAHCYWR